MENIIKFSGNAQQVCASLETLRAIFGKGATLEEIAKTTHRARIAAVRVQFNGERGTK